jgi:hypothetical protein
MGCPYMRRKYFGCCYAGVEAEYLDYLGTVVDRQKYTPHIWLSGCQIVEVKPTNPKGACINRHPRDLILSALQIFQDLVLRNK